MALARTRRGVGLAQTSQRRALTHMEAARASLISLTPPAFLRAKRCLDCSTTPFTMTSSSQFRPEERLTPLDSEEWVDDYNRTKLW